MAGTKLVQSVLRSLDILEMVARSEGGVSLQDIAGALDVSSPTAHNLARTLIARGYIEKSSRPVRYHLGSACIDLIQTHMRREVLQQATEAVRELWDAFPDANVIFAQAIGSEVVTVVRVGPERPGVIQRAYHQPLYPYSSAVSLVYQAFSTEPARDAFRRHHPFQETGAHHWGTPARLDEFLEDVRRLGYAHIPAGTAAETLRCATPVFGPNGVLFGMLGLSLGQSFAGGVASEEIIQKLTAAATRIGAGRGDDGG